MLVVGVWDRTGHGFTAPTKAIRDVLPSILSAIGLLQHGSLYSWGPRPLRDGLRLEPERQARRLRERCSWPQREGVQRLDAAMGSKGSLHMILKANLP